MPATESALALVAIIVMAVATYVMRAAGFWLMARVPLTPRVRGMLGALPGAIVAAIVLPIVARGGPAAMLGISAALALMIAARNEILAIGVGVAAAALARAAGL